MIASYPPAPAIGSIALGLTAPDDTYVACDPTVPLLQADYPELFSQLGLQPSYNTTARTFFPSNSIIDIAYSPTLGLYLALAANSGWPWIYTSADGITWNTPLAGTQDSISNTSIAWCSGLGIFITCSGLTTVNTSTDGVIWKPSLVNADASVSFVATDGTTILVAGASDTDNSLQYVFTTTDGVSWTRRQIAVTGKTITALHYSTGLSLWFMGCSDGSIQTSPDGTTWTSRTSNIASQINQFASYASLVVAVGNSGVISSSPTGVTWTARTQQTAHNLLGVAYSPTATIPWIAMGASVRMTSTDGTTWLTVADTMPGKANVIWSSTDSQYVKFGAVRFIAKGSTLSSWTAETPATTGLLANAMNAGAYGNGAYVIVGAGGKIDSSPDAVTWTNRTANAGTNALSHVIYAGGSAAVFVAVGAGNTIVTSADGTTWTARTSNVVSTLAAVAYNQAGNVLVAVGSSGKITRSTDGGVNWASQTSNTGVNLAGVAWNGTIFVAVGATGVVITSTDGATWVKQTPTKFGSQGITWITSDGTSFYAITDGNTVYISTDGITWTGYGSPCTMQALNWTGTVLVAYSANGDIYTATDGKAWTGVGSQQGVAACTKAYWIGSAFLSGGPGVGRSSDGVTWTRTYAVSFGPGTFNGIAYSHNRHLLVAVGAFGLIATSSDHGVTWSVNYSYSGSTAISWTGVARSESLDRFVAVSASGMIATSSDGITWTTRVATSQYFGTSLATSNVLFGVIRGGGLFVAFGAGSSAILTSPDGITWTERISGTFLGMNQMAYSSTLGMYAAVGGRGIIITSPDAITWTIHNIEMLGAPGIASIGANGFLVSVNGGAMAAISADGVTWRLAQVRGAFAPVGFFYNAIDACIYWHNVTPSGINFRSARTPQDALLSLEWVSSAPIITFVTGSVHSVYDADQDAIIDVAQGGVVFVSQRSYDKATQFVVPASAIGSPAWIKARA